MDRMYDLTKEFFTLKREYEINVASIQQQINKHSQGQERLEEKIKDIKETLKKLTENDIAQ